MAWEYLANLKPSKGGYHRNQFSRLHFMAFILASSLIGLFLYLSLAAPNPNLPGDLNNDNKVDGADLAFLASVWKTSNASADLNSDSTVNIADLSILLAHYGQTYAAAADINVKTQYGTTDSAIRSAISAAQSQGKGLYFPAGTYHYSNTLDVNGIALHGDGPSTIMIPDNHDFSSIKLTGTNPSVSNMLFQVSNAAAGGDGGAGAAVWIYHATNAKVDHITSSGTQGPPIFDEGSAGSLITYNNIINSMTGGIAFVAGANNAEAAYNLIRNCSDDMISVVSDMVYPTKNSYINIHDNTLDTQDWGRGIAVVGGDHITVKNNSVSHSFGAGIYIVVEGNYNTYGNSNIIVDSNTVRNPDQSNTHNANILVGSYQSPNSTTGVSGANNNLDPLKPGIGLIGNYSNVNIGWAYSSSTTSDINVKTQYGTTDSAIRSAISAAQSQGKGLYFPAGTYNYSSKLTFNGIKVHGDGDATILLAATKSSMAMALDGNGVELRSLKVTCPQCELPSGPPTAARLGTGDSAGIFILPTADHFVVDHVTVERAGSAGILNWGGSFGTITYNTVNNTLADGIHNTNGANNIEVAYNHENNVGDDMFAVVSYLSDGKQSHDIQIHDNVGNGQPWGRGATVVGGYNVQIYNNSISHTYGAGIYIEAEGGTYNTYGDSAITLNNNIIRLPDQGNIHNCNIKIGTYNTTQTTTNVTGTGNNLDRSKPGIDTSGNFSGVNVGWAYGD